MKALTGLLASLVLALGLLVAPGSTVAANAAACTYAPTVHPSIALARVGPAKFSFQLNAGNRHPNAWVTIKVYRTNTGRLVKTLNRWYAGETPRVFWIGPLSRGRYTARFIANPPACKYFTARASITFFRA